MVLDMDSGAANGDANILRIMPLYTFSIFERWKLVNLTIMTLADAPSGTPAFPGNPSTEHATGLSDLLHASFVTPNGTNQFIWGAGVMLSIPTATDKALGSDKWTVGPAVRLTFRTEKWNFGMIAGQRWSVQGYYNVVKPDPAPDWVFRFAFVTAIPFGDK